MRSFPLSSSHKNLHCWGVCSFVAFLAVTTLLGAGESSTLEAGPAVESITEREMRGHLEFLASDALAGRDTGTAEERIAAHYLAGHLRAMGLEPAGDPIAADQPGGERSYFARFPLRRVQPDREGTKLTLAFDSGDVSRTVHLAATREFVVSPRGLEPGAIEGAIVFASEGIVTDRRNDYDGLDVEGKFALIAPAAVGGGRRGSLSFAAIRAQRRAAEAAGAAGLLIVRPAQPALSEGAESSEPPKPFREALSWANRSFDRTSILLGHGEREGDDNPEGSNPRIPVLYLETAANDFLVDSGFRSDGERGALDGLSAEFTYSAIEEKIWSQNVVGMVPGKGDADRRSECVVFSAHYDHVGVGAKGEIFNGADDNATGTGALLEVAEAMAASPPNGRSVVFLWVSAEEKGLLGSEWWVDHPTLPAGSTIVANVNMDMVGRNEPARVSVCPSPKHEGFSSIGPLVAAACKLESFTPVYDADRYYRRTDSYNFAEKGIPSVFLFTGEHDDYHRETDTIEKINFEKATGIARIAYHVGYALAQAPERPSITGPEESDAAEADGEPADGAGSKPGGDGGGSGL